jgi:hypothetical protein
VPKTAGHPEIDARIAVLFESALAAPEVDRVALLLELCALGSPMFEIIGR